VAAARGWGAVAAALGLALATRRGRLALGLERVEVAGHSMQPTLQPGDRLLVHGPVRPRQGDFVALSDPREPGRTVVKRAAAPPGVPTRVASRWLPAAPGEVVVAGDNPEASTDSRSYGAVALGRIHGRVWHRYAPAPRAGRLKRDERLRRARRGRREG
jgi:signal peptidase I